jgi:hypothetical protein
MKMAARTTVRFGWSFQITVILLQADFGQLCNSSPAALNRKDHVNYPQHSVRLAEIPFFIVR